MENRAMQATKIIENIRALFFSACMIAFALYMATVSVHSTRAAIASSETTFTETSAHGMNIMPASCDSAPWLFHEVLNDTPDGMGYHINGGGTFEHGAYAPYVGQYVCVINSSPYEYFIPAHNLTELQSFKTYGPRPGVVVY